MTITCAEMGYTCGYAITGKSMDQIISGIKHHALEFHDYTKDEVEKPEMIESWKGGVRQSARPDAIRTPRVESERNIVPH
jgi:predicted small metal-binding protein